MDYSYYFGAPEPSHQHIHEFLKHLNEYTGKESAEAVTNLVKKYLKTGFFQSSFNTHEEIFNSAKTLISDVVKMDSLSDAQKELSGAIMGLNILLRHETNESNQTTIIKELTLLGQYKSKIEDIFLIKEAIKGQPQLVKIIDSPDFIRDFEALTFLYGRKRKIEVPLVRSLIHAWLDPQIRPLLRTFINAAHQTRQINLNILREGKLVMPEDNHNQNLALAHGMLTQASINLEDFRNFKALIDDLFNNRALVTNTQIHTDGLNLAFNTQANDTLSNRTKGSIAQGEKDYQNTMTQLREAEKNPTLDQRKVKREIELWERLEGYHPRPVGFIYEKSVWEPPIGPEDPIQPVTRSIGFATKEGLKNESHTLLDFTKALGKENLQLSVNERLALCELLNACNSEVMKDVNVIKTWQETQKPPESISNVLTSFNNDEFSHLKTLSSAQKEALVSEALRFAFEVNYHLAYDLLNL